MTPIDRPRIKIMNDAAALNARQRGDSRLPLSGHSMAAKCPATSLQSVCNVALATGRAVAFNDFGSQLAAGLAGNASVASLTVQGGGDWLEVAPYHEGDYWTQEAGRPVKYTQVFTRPQAEKMVAAFNAQAMSKGARFRGLPVYAGHPDADPKRWPDERRLGGIVNLQAQPGGLFARIAWNVLGRENLEQSYLVYPSPGWLYDEPAARASKVIEPDELRSVGLTNSPWISQVKAWTNAQPSCMPPQLRACAQSLGVEVDISNPAGRLQAFNERLDELMRPKGKGGGGLALNAAIEQMSDKPRRPGIAPSDGARLGGERGDAPAAAAAPVHTLPGLATPASRTAAFNARVNELMCAREIPFETAVNSMRFNEADRALLKAMGAF